MDELIGAKEEELEKLRQMKAALLEAMFPNEEKQINVNGGGYKCIDIKYLPEGFCLSEGSADTPRLRFRGFTEPWQRKKLGEVCILRSGFPFSSKTYTENGKYSIITIANVLDGKFEPSASKRIDYIPNALLDYQLLRIGDLLISLTGNIGRVCTVNTERCLLNQRVGLIDILSDNSLFIEQALRHPTFQQFIQDQGQGSAQKNVGKQDFDIYEFSLPSLKEQEQIGEFFRSQDEGIVAVGEQIERLRAMKQACLERMFA